LEEPNSCELRAVCMAIGLGETGQKCKDIRRSLNGKCSRCSRWGFEVQNCDCELCFGIYKVFFLLWKLKDKPSEK
jgi:hypothetical protein